MLRTFKYLSKLISINGFCKEYLDNIVDKGIFDITWTTAENDDAVNYVKQMLTDKKYTFNDIMKDFYENPDGDVDGIGLGGIEIYLKDITYSSMKKVTWKVNRANYPDFKWQNRSLSGDSARGFVIYKVTYSDDFVCYVKGNYVYNNLRN